MFLINSMDNATNRSNYFKDHTVKYLRAKGDNT